MVGSRTTTRAVALSACRCSVAPLPRLGQWLHLAIAGLIMMGITWPIIHLRSAGILLYSNIIVIDIPSTPYLLRTKFLK